LRIAVSGAQGTGKSTLIAAFLGHRPSYTYEPEAYEVLADDVDLTSSEGPTPEGLETLLQYTVSTIAARAADPDVVFERSPVDYLAYAAANRSTWDRDAVASFLRASVPAVRVALRSLDLIVLLPVSREGPISAGADDDARYRNRVDRRLRQALVDDDYDLFGHGSPRVVELPALPDRQLVELLRLA
jgi:hypothetical protein